MPQLSIVIPAAGLQEDLDASLVAILENRPESCEIVVPHAPAYEDPYDLSDEVEFVCCDRGDLASLINSGIAHGQSEFVHVVLGGVRATAGWTDAVLERFRENHSLSAAAPLLIDPNDPRRVLGAGVRYLNRGAKRITGRGSKVARFRQKRPIDGPPIQAGFFRRSALAAIGPLNNRFGTDHIESDLAARLRGHQLSCELVAESQLVGVPSKPRRGFRASKNNELLYWHHRGLGSRIMGSIAHGCHVTVDLMGHLPYPDVLTACLGRGTGLLSAMFQSRHQYTSDPGAVVLNFCEERAKITSTQEDRPNEQLPRSA